MKSSTPKVLHRVCGREMIALLADTAKEAGFDNLIMVTPESSQELRTVVGDSAQYVVQKEARGSGHAVLAAKTAASAYEQIMVLYADVPLLRPETIKTLLRVHKQYHATATILTFKPEKIHGLGRVVRDQQGLVKAIVEEADADETTKAISEANAGVYCFNGDWLWKNLEGLNPSPKGEVYLTDLIGRAFGQGNPIADVSLEDPTEALGVNDRIQLAEAEAVLRQRICERWMLAGVTIKDPQTTYIETEATIGQDTTLLPNTYIRGRSAIGKGCEIGPNSIVEGSEVGDRCRIFASVVEESRVENDVVMGPYSHVRQGSLLQKGVHLGNYAEVKASRIGPSSKAGHFSYVGDADVGANVNIGAGTITCNFDGKNKHKTTIGDGAFIGSDTMLVAPVTVGPRAKTGAGSVVTKDVAADTLVFGVPAKESRRRKPKSSTSGS